MKQETFDTILRELKILLPDSTDIGHDDTRIAQLASNNMEINAFAILVIQTLGGVRSSEVPQMALKLTCAAFLLGYRFAMAEVERKKPRIELQ